MSEPTPSQNLDPATGPDAPQKNAEAINRGCFQFAILLAAALVLSYLPLPIRMAALVMTLWAIVVAARVIVTYWDSKKAHRTQFTALGIGVGASLMIALLLASTLLRWDTDMQLQRCLSEAITHQAQESCTKEYRDSLTDMLPQR